MLTVLNYHLSYAKFLGTLFGLLTVILVARANIWTWPTGIINELFFQVQLYAKWK
ncbi:nicotinamide mononucleotide transporter family protein [Entomomonas sp. E2T0]|uniref:nicotinamide mononucleotide transporter family protein n=1 Tax=Entomomonas sp. E2T0 TaxID=2930213 RepID=UPI0022282428|nr:nicotinamide mononucleotide transporter family protein [Entomomonas sp. E2T0]UYZ85470.1 nicotinamide mononucleotide transporter family protein [Entomomonas sp. E2T0]